MNLVEVQMDTTELLRKLELVAGDKGSKRFVYAVVNAINSTAKLVQAGEIEHVRDVFTVRKTDFLLGTPSRPGGAAARIKPFASVKDARPYAEISVGASSATAQRTLLLSQFEAGGIRKPFTPGAKAVGVPITGRPARPSIGREVPPAFTFAGLKLRPYRAGRKLSRKAHAATIGVPGGKDAVQWKGENRTFIIRKADGAPQGGVFQRTGKERGDIREIIEFRKNDPIDKRLGFVVTANRIADVWFPRYMEQELAKTFARAGLS